MAQYDVVLKTPNGGEWPFQTKEGNYTPEKAAILVVVDALANIALMTGVSFQRLLGNLLEDIQEIEIVVTEVVADKPDTVAFEGDNGETFEYEI